MKGYWIALYTRIDNMDNLQRYGEKVTPVIKSYGGKPLVRGGKYQTLEGKNFTRTVIREFPSCDKAIECYESKEYQDGWDFAKNTTERNLQIIEGFNTEQVHYLLISTNTMWQQNNKDQIFFLKY